MLQRITDLWPSLLRHGQNMDSDGSEGELANSDDEQESRATLRVDAGQVQKDYKNLYWTRMIRVENYEPVTDLDIADNRYRWPLEPDILDHCNAVADLPEADPEGWEPLFQADSFVEQHDDIRVESFRLPNEDLEVWADRAVKLRAAIVARARDHDQSASVDS